MREQYRDHAGRTEPRGGLYLGNLKIGSVVKVLPDGPIAKVVYQSDFSTDVARFEKSVRVFTPKRGPRAGETIKIEGAQRTETWSRGTIVQRARA